MAVRAYMALVLPSTFVFNTRRMCWKLGETTNDIFSEIDKEVKEPLNVEPVVYNKMFGNTNIIGGRIYSFSSVRSLACPLVTLMASWAARSTMIFLNNNKKYNVPLKVLYSSQ